MPFLGWDVDGVLIDTDAAHEKALNDALATFGYQRISHAEHLATFKGHPTRVKLDWLIAHERLKEADRQKVADLKQQLTPGAIRKVAIDLEKPRLLKQLKADGWEMCAVSNAVRASVKVMLQHAAVLPYLDFFLSNEDALPKPAPDLYLLAADRFGILPEGLVVVEDGAPGIEAARKARTRLVQVRGPADVTLQLLPKLRSAAGLKESHQ